VPRHPVDRLPLPPMLMNKMWVVEERKDKTVYRRRCPTGGEILSCFFVSACAFLFLLICVILYGTRSQSPSLPPLIKEYLPAGRCQCEFSTTFSCDTALDCASNQAILTGNATQEEEKKYWTFKYSRDRNNYGLDEAQCDSAFPGQYEDIERAVHVRRRWGKVTEADLDSFELTKGMVRAMIYDREVRSAFSMSLMFCACLLAYSYTSSKPTWSIPSIARKRSRPSAPCTVQFSPRPLPPISQTSSLSSPWKTSPRNPQSLCGRLPAVPRITISG
jgi:hypothetical protein